MAWPRSGGALCAESVTNGVRVSDEQWFLVPGFDDIYSISSACRVRRNYGGRILAPSVPESGPETVNLYRAGTWRPYVVSELLANAMSAHLKRKALVVALRGGARRCALAFEDLKARLRAAEALASESEMCQATNDELD